MNKRWKGNTGERREGDKYKKGIWEEGIIIPNQF
jgi:hypothetical protein